MAKITNLEHPCWVVARPDDLWFGPFKTEEQAKDFLKWKIERGELEPLPQSVKQTTIGRILERIEQNSKQETAK